MVASPAIHHVPLFWVTPDQTQTTFDGHGARASLIVKVPEASKMYVLGASLSAAGADQVPGTSAARGWSELQAAGGIGAGAAARGRQLSNTKALHEQGLSP